MKKTLILGATYVEILTNTIGEIKANEDFDTSESIHFVSGGGYQSALMLQKMDFPYFLGVYLASGDYGKECQDKAKEMNIAFEVNEEVGGCKYRIINKDTETTSFTVAGGEYKYDLDMIELLDPEEYSGTIIFSEMLVNDDALVVLAVLASMEKPIYFVVDDRIMEVDPDVLGALFELKPTVFIGEKDANILYADDVMEIDRILDDMYFDVGNDIYLVHHEDGIYHFDGKERVVMPGNNLDVTRSAIGYVIARSANVDKRNALLYAKEIGEMTLEDVEGDISNEKDRLIRMISYK